LQRHSVPTASRRRVGETAVVVQTQHCRKPGPHPARCDEAASPPKIPSDPGRLDDLACPLPAPPTNAAPGPLAGGVSDLRPATTTAPGRQTKNLEMKNLQVKTLEVKNLGAKSPGVKSLPLQTSVPGAAPAGSHACAVFAAAAGICETRDRSMRSSSLDRRSGRIPPQRAT